MAVQNAQRNARNAQNAQNAQRGHGGGHHSYPDPEQERQREMEREMERRRQNEVHKALACTSSPCTVGERVEVMRSIVRDGLTLQAHGTATISAVGELYTVKSDCTGATFVGIHAVQLMRRSAVSCPAGKLESESSAPQSQSKAGSTDRFKSGDKVVTTQSKIDFDEGDRGEVREVLGAKGAYKVCFEPGEVVKKSMMQGGGTKCKGGKELQVAHFLLAAA